MKNLNKVLSVLLAGAMATSLMGAAFAADVDFGDADEINNTEAVAVMTALGVIQGDENGDFNPEGKLTRETAAKIITYMLLGEKDAEALNVTSAPFSDVAATRWSAPYVAYCAEQGIIAGDGSGKFNPTSELTSTQFAKMLLVALGYDAEIENMVGGAWAINTSSLAVKAGLNDNIGALTEKTTMTREAATQMAFNTLKATMVDYANRGTKITLSDGTSVVVGASSAQPVSAYSGSNYNSAAAATYDALYLQFCEEYFPDLSLTTSDNDGMQRPAHTWVYKTSDVVTAVDEADYTAYVTNSNNTVADVIKNINKKFDATSATHYVNGDTTLTNENAIGNKVELYMNSTNAKKVDKIVVTHYSVAEVTGAAATKVSDDKTLVKVPGVINAYKTAYTTDTVSGYADLAKGDIVLYYEDVDHNVVIEKADSFEGVLTSSKGTSAGNKNTIDGNAYYVSGATNTFSGLTITDYYKENATWFTDKGGNIIWVKGVESSELVYILDDGSKQDAYNNNTYYAMLAKMDGTVVDVEVSASATSDVGKFATYTVDKDGVYTLTASAAYSSGTTEGFVAGTSSETAAVTKGNPEIDLGTTAGKFTATNNTVFLIRDYNTSTSASKNSFTLYTGYANVPSTGNLTLATDVTATVYADKDGYAKYVVIDPKSNISGVSTASDVFFVVDANVTTLYNKDGISGYSVKAIKNGGEDVVDLEFASSPSVSAGSAYTITGYNSDGQIASISGSALSTGGQYVVSSGTNKANNGTIKLGSTALAYTDDTVVYYVDADGEVTKTTIADIETDANDTFVAIRCSATTTDDDYNTIKTLFVQQVKTDAQVTIGTDLSSSDTATSGTAKTFTIAATCSNGGTLTYQWYVDGTAVDGATSATFTYTWTATGAATVKCVITGTDLTVDGNTTATKTSTECTVTIS